MRWEFTYSFTKVHRDEQRLLSSGNDLFSLVLKRKKEELKFLTAQKVSKNDKTNPPNARNFIEKCISMEQNGILNRDNVLDQMRLGKK